MDKKLNQTIKLVNFSALGISIANGICALSVLALIFFSLSINEDGALFNNVWIHLVYICLWLTIFNKVLLIANLYLTSNYHSWKYNLVWYIVIVLTPDFFAPLLNFIFSIVLFRFNPRIENAQKSNVFQYLTNKKNLWWIILSLIGAIVVLASILAAIFVSSVAFAGAIGMFLPGYSSMWILLISIFILIAEKINFNKANKKNIS